MPAAPAAARPPAARVRPPVDRPPRTRRPTAARPSSPEPFPPPVDPRFQKMPHGRLVLGGATWAVYRALRDAPENDRFKMTYDGPAGLLEIEMGEGPLHATVGAMLAVFVQAFRRERGLRVWCVGCVTLAREDLDRGLESDGCFYVGGVDAAPDLTANMLDLDAGAPPDLAIEVDVTSPGVSKLPGYAALGVPEVWVWNAADGRLTARRLDGDGGYEVVAESRELPGFPLAAAADLIRDRGGRDDGELEAAFVARLPGGD